MKFWRRSILITAGLLVISAGAVYAQLPDPQVHEFPYAGNRAAVWVVAQLHILFAAFILGAPIFVVISEILGWKNRDGRYERLAKEVTKVTVILPAACSSSCCSPRTRSSRAG
jgi:cytochrome d ubiquinol oxidase subunit I